ncbi:uncharacterized protein JCM15063_003756 [Sporobolomyces koalae]|uniref:uncharacterized protein n=1 Tax=Sporobolomyces koalae TaxID=500713 RepID=UPI0031822B71
MRRPFLTFFTTLCFTILLSTSTWAQLDRRAVGAPLVQQLDKRDVVGASGNERLRGVPFGRPPFSGDYQDRQAGKRTNLDSKRKGDVVKDADGAVNYLITLERTVTNDVKDRILDILLRSGAVVKQTYDYRVFKGILFTIPNHSDQGLVSWQQSLGKQEGVKYVEEDTVVKVQ